MDWNAFAKAAGFSNGNCAGTRWGQIKKRLQLTCGGRNNSSSRKPPTTPPPHAHGNMSEPKVEESPSPLSGKSATKDGCKVQKSTSLTPTMRKMTTRGIKVKTYAPPDYEDDFGLFKSELDSDFEPQAELE